MKIKFTKNTHRHKEGDVVEKKDGVAKYLIKVGAATTDVPDDKTIHKTLSKKLKSTKKKK